MMNTTTTKKTYATTADRFLSILQSGAYAHNEDAHQQLDDILSAATLVQRFFAEEISGEQAIVNEYELTDGSRLFVTDRKEILEGETGWRYGDSFSASIALDCRFSEQEALLHLPEI